MATANFFLDVATIHIPDREKNLSLISVSIEKIKEEYDTVIDAMVIFRAYGK